MAASTVVSAPTAAATWAATAAAWSRSRGWASMTSPPTLALSSAATALGDRAAVVDDDDAVREVVRLLEVLRGQQHVGAVAHELADGLPEPDPARRVEAGRRLVEQQQLRCADERGAEVEPAAEAARPPAHEPGTRLGEVESFEDVVGPAPRLGLEKPNRRATISRFSRPVMASSTAAYWPARPMTERTCRGCRKASMPATAERGRRRDW